MHTRIGSCVFKDTPPSQAKQPRNEGDLTGVTCQACLQGEYMKLGDLSTSSHALTAASGCLMMENIARMFGMRAQGTAEQVPAASPAPPPEEPIRGPSNYRWRRTWGDRHDADSTVRIQPLRIGRHVTFGGETVSPIETGGRRESPEVPPPVQAGQAGRQALQSDAEERVQRQSILMDDRRPLRSTRSKAAPEPAPYARWPRSDDPDRWWSHEWQQSEWTSSHRLPEPPPPVQPDPASENADGWASSRWPDSDTISNGLSWPWPEWPGPDEPGDIYL